MPSRFRLILAALVLSTVATACTDSTAPVQAGAPSLKAGVPGSGSGGGGTGGGTGGGGGGTSVGQIQATGTVATCDKGSTYAITVRKGFQNRAELVINASANPIPTGPAIPPSSFPGTSIGGYTTFTMVNDATGAVMYGFAGNTGYSVQSFTQTTLAGTLPVGTTVVRFTWVNQQLDGIQIPADLASVPVYETCTAVLSIFAK
jgi:hypothetical protein